MEKQSLGKDAIENLLPWVRTIKLCVDHLEQDSNKLPGFALEYFHQIKLGQLNLQRYLNGELVKPAQPEGSNE